MGIKIFSVGVSDYDDLEPIPYCNNDANVFSKVIHENLLTSVPLVFLDNQVTVSSLPRKFKKFCDDLNSGDTLIFFYAGHGCNHNEISYLSAYDSEDSPQDIEETWISLETLRKIARKSQASKRIFFIDACQAVKKDKRSSLLDSLDIREAIDVENENEYEIVLFSCSKGQAAISSKSLEHGVWTYYLIQAFSCSEIGKPALNENYELRVSRLQDFLHLKVREYFTSKGRQVSQKPRGDINSGIDPILTSFPPAKVEKYQAIPDKHLNRITYQAIEIKDVDDLPGFIKKPYNRKHHVPDEYNSRTSSFVKRIGNEVVLEIIQYAKQNLIELFDLLPDTDINDGGFKYEPPEDEGYASFECQFLRFEVTLDLDEEDPSHAIINSELIPYDQNMIFEMREELDSCFLYWFDKMVFTGKSFKMADLYKRLKKHEKKDGLPFTLKYMDEQQCFEIVLESGRTITFYNSKIEIGFKGTESLDKLLESLKEVSNTLLQIDNQTKLLS
ncbi:MAG: caspase family protein [Desulfobacula sp.]|nr:caspase family protein [Desulfobacula sp.]